MLRITAIFSLLLFSALLAACDAAPPPTPLPAAPAPLVVYGWAGYIPQSILDAFTREFRIPIRYVAYDDQKIAMDQLRAGAEFDVVILGDSYIPPATAEGLLAPLDMSKIDNFRNLGVDYRDLAYDPGNQYTIMVQYGVTGLVVRTDRVTQPVKGWADLWNPDYAGDIGVWPFGDELIGIALKSMGYPLNSEDPAQLRAAEEKLLELSNRVYLLDPALPSGAPHLLDDHTVMIYGWSYDAMEAMESIDTIAFVLPEEGTILWTDNLTIPANSRQQQAAAEFINFLLRPQISAQMVNETWIPSPNEAALPYIDPQILNNPFIYPTNVDLKHAEFYAVVSPQTQQLHDKIWARFLAAREPAARPTTMK